MARIGLQTWGSEGDVQPFLALASGLAQAGHDVQLVLTTQADRLYLSPPGVALSRVGPPITGEEGDALLARVAALGSPLKQARLVLEEGFAPSADAMTEAAEALVASCDLVIRHHFLHMTQAMALRAGVPELSVYLTPDLVPTRHHAPTGLPSLGPAQGLGWWLVDRAIGSVFLEPARRLRSSLGLPAPTSMLREVWCSRTANLVAVSPALFPRPADWPARTHLTGFWAGPVTHSDAIEPALEAFLASGAPPLYASFGSLSPRSEPRRSETAELLVRAARAVGRRLVIQLPPGAAVEGEDLLVVTGSPHASVFPRCAAIIHHGGAGVTQTAIRSGVVSVVVPHFADQVFWAAQVEQLAAGVAAPPRSKVSVKSLTAALTRALRHERSPALTALAAALDAENGVAQATMLIGDLLAALGR